MEGDRETRENGETSCRAELGHPRDTEAEARVEHRPDQCGREGVRPREARSVLCEVSERGSTFDPDDKLNPGKIVPSKRAENIPVSIEGPLKGRFDQEVSQSLQADYSSAFRCNGNGACFHYHQDVVMCPSYKATGDRIHSPKGRAMILREWLRLRFASSPEDG